LIRLTDDGLSWFGKWSSDGASIVFGHISPLTNQVVISTMSAGRNARKTDLTSEFWHSFIPTYTPDGKKIVFISQLEGLVSAAWIMNRDGSNQTRLTAARLEGGPWDVSPDGQRILLTNHENTSIPSAIYVMKQDGSDLQQLTRPGMSYDAAPRYSPDGKKIVFISNRLSLDQSLDLFTMNADGSDVKRIASGLTLGGCPDQNCVVPSWGPKPKQ
jgi:Tol biopolymer transport system component